MKQITLYASEYNGVMKAVKNVVAKDGTRPELRGAYLEVEGHSARFTALNGFAMSHFVVPLEDETEEPWSVIMPVVSVKAQPNALIAIYAFEESVTVKNIYTGEAVTSPTIARDYMKYRQLINEPSAAHRFYVDARVLRNALDAAALCGDHLIEVTVNKASQISPIFLRGKSKTQTYTGMVMPVKPGDTPLYISHVI